MLQEVLNYPHCIHDLNLVATQRRVDFYRNILLLFGETQQIICHAGTHVHYSLLWIIFNEPFCY
jgi:hypothetical protein